MNLKGRHFKAKKDFAMSIGQCKKEDLFEIISDDKCILLKNKSEWSWNFGNPDVELMPENFDPNNIVTELEIEIW
jgi:hypothetical protein